MSDTTDDMDAGAQLMEDYFEIDEDALDQEWIGQSKKTEELTRQAAHARKEYTDAEDELELILSQLMLKVRSSPESYGFDDTPPMPILKAKVVTLKKYRIALRKVREKREVMDIVNGAVQAMEHRKKALENLSYLHGAAYRSEPNERRMSAEQREAFKDAKQRRVRKGIKRT